MNTLDMVTEAEKNGAIIKLISHNIAFRIGKVIYINRNMLRYPEYFKKVLDHELRHSNTYTKNDLKMDLVEGSLLDNLKFSLRHPGSITYWSPIGWYNGEFSIDITQIIAYIIGIGALLLFFKIF